MQPNTFLRAEGLAVFGAAVGAYLWLDGPLWLFALLILAPDLSMLGYLGGSRVGSIVYNTVHAYVGPLALVGFATWQGVETGMLVGLVWLAHIGADRTMGYGLKLPSGFKQTHLGPIGGGQNREAMSGDGDEATAESN